MLVQGYNVGDTLTLILPDGTQIHGCVQSITEKQVRITWVAPDEVKIKRDTTAAARIFSEHS